MHGLLSPGDRVLVGVSGGPDSTALLLCLRQLQRKLDIELVAAHVNHRLRGAAADADEACAAESAAALGVAFVRVELPPGLARGANLEARARRLRYAALRELAVRHGCAKIATGHTIDDQAETVLMRLLRGSSGRGLGAIRPRRADGIVRPLIDCRRADLTAVLRGAGLRSRRDASNRDRRFLRTHVRERVLPLLAELNPAIVRACANLAAAARAERRIVSDWADARLAEVGGQGELRIAWLRRIDPSLRCLLVRRWLLRNGVSPRGLTTRHIEAVRGLAESVRGGTQTHLPRGWRVQRSGGVLSVDRAASNRRRAARR